MIHWAWLIPAVIVGKAMGIAVMAILYGSWDRKEQKERSASAATLTNRERGDNV